MLESLVLYKWTILVSVDVSALLSCVKDKEAVIFVVASSSFINRLLVNIISSNTSLLLALINTLPALVAPNNALILTLLVELFST